MKTSNDKFIVNTGMNSNTVSLDSPASALMVNRTHRVVRERAQLLKARRSRIRSLWIPMIVCSALLIILCSAVWSVLDQYELVPTGVPDSGDQMLVLLLWFFPVSAAVLAMVWFRRTRDQAKDEVDL